MTSSASIEKVDAWMPLWIGAYLADTMSLSRDSHGGYLLILFAYWRNKGPLPDDDEDMAAITKATPAEWKKLRPRLAKFFTIEDGYWIHGRAEKELAAAGLRKSAAVSKAKAGAEARWKDHKKKPPSNAPSNAPSMPEALLDDVRKQCPTPPPKEKEAIASSSPAGADDHPPPERLPCPHGAIRALYAKVLPELPQIRTWDSDRERALRQRWTSMAAEKGWSTVEEGIDWFRRFFVAVSENDWAMGRTARGKGHENWECDIDYLISTKGFRRIIETAGRTKEPA